MGERNEKELLRLLTDRGVHTLAAIIGILAYIWAHETHRPNAELAIIAAAFVIFVVGVVTVVVLHNRNDTTLDEWAAEIKSRSQTTNRGG